MTAASQLSCCALASALLLCGRRAEAERPDEAQLFGAAGAAASDSSRDAALLGGMPDSPPTPVSIDDPLRVGGQLYLRARATALKGQRFGDFAFGTPSLLDVYLDSRPNDRVRGMVLGRFAYDATLPDGAASTLPLASPAAATNGELSSADAGGPQGMLDQLWLRFDVAHQVFVTAGKQHVRWGTGKLWTPTDYLHLRARNPLDPFDSRPGRTMVKLNLPIESKAWNFYAFGVTENQDGTVGLGKVAAAARAELVFGNAEVAAGVFARRGERPKFAADLSTGIGDFDLYGELAVLDAGALDRVRRESRPVIPPEQEPPAWQTPSAARVARLEEVVELVYPRYREDGYRIQAVAGLGFTQKYNANDTLSLGAEYFYNQLGYSDATVYPGLFLPRSAPLSSPSAFHLGRHYGALFLALPAPFSLDLHSFTLTTIGNFSDRSFTTRVDYSLTLLTHLTFEAFAALRYGVATGEFRFGVSPIDLDGTSFRLPPTLMDFGVALRLAI